MSLTNYGGVCDGRTLNDAAIANGLADAKAKGVPLVLPAGQCNHSNVIHLNGAKMTGFGDTSILYATSYTNAAVILEGDGSQLSNMKLDGVPAPSRQSSPPNTMVWVNAATNFLVDRTTIDGRAGVYGLGGIFIYGAHQGTISNNTVSNTYADSIHNTHGTSYVNITGNTVTNSGDDGIAVVSYQSDGSVVNNITATDNKVLNNRYGRNMSVVGGDRITYQNNYINGNPQYAGLYVAQEASWNSYQVTNSSFIGNTIINTGSNTTGHGAILEFTEQAGMTNSNLLFQLNDIQQNGQSGIRYWGSASNISFDRNRVNGTGSWAPISGNISGVSVSPYTSGSVGYVAP